MDQNQQIITWLKDAHAFEQSLEIILQAQIAESRDVPEMQQRLQQHLEETREHRRRVASALGTLGESPSKIKTLAGGFMGMLEGLSTAVFQDRAIKNVLADYAMEHFEIACYRSLRVAANEAGFTDIATMCEEILKEETAMAEWLEEQIPDITRAHLQGQPAKL
ncbi:MAG: ferritin-like domain-containing protein [Opitutaceae bacterium]|nr:ferritin-like domain-containing protein [Opitutaceae bacterium]